MNYMNCQKCGEKILPGAKFCTKCGKPISEAESLKTKVQTATGRNVKTGKRRVVILIVSILFMIIWGKLTSPESDNLLELLLYGMLGIGYLVFLVWPLFIIALLAYIAYRLTKKVH